VVNGLEPNKVPQAAPLREKAARLKVSRHQVQLLKHPNTGLNSMPDTALNPKLSILMSKPHLEAIVLAPGKILEHGLEVVAGYN